MDALNDGVSTNPDEQQPIEIEYIEVTSKASTAPHATSSAANNNVPLFNNNNNNNNANRSSFDLQKGQSKSEEKNEKEVHKGKESKCYGFGLLVADNILTALVIGPLTVLFWQGLWDLLGRNIFPENELLNWLVCSLMGNVGILTAAFSQTLLSDHLKPNRVIDWGLGYHVYTYLLGLFNVSQWRGLWIMLDTYTGATAQSAWTSFLAGYFMLCAFRCLKTAEAPPMSVTMDTEPDLYRHSTRFNKKPKFSFNYVLDTLFTVIIIQQLVVLYWRGAWGIMDQYVFPDDPQRSAICTLIGSYVLQALVCIVQPFFNAAYRRVHGNIRRTLLEYVIFSVANLIAIAHWRGIWMLSAANFMPDQPDIGCSISHAFGIIVLMLMLCGHSVAMKGCEVDGSSTPEDGCYSHNKYFRYFHATRLAAAERLLNERLCTKDQLLLSNDGTKDVLLRNNGTKDHLLRSNEGVNDRLLESNDCTKDSLLLSNNYQKDRLLLNNDCQKDRLLGIDDRLLESKDYAKDSLLLSSDYQKDRLPLRSEKDSVLLNNINISCNETLDNIHINIEDNSILVTRPETRKEFTGVTDDINFECKNTEV